MTEFEQELGIAPVEQTAADIAAETAMEIASGDRPDWLPLNFKEPEALVRSYQEAQNKIREQGTELGQLRKQVEEMVAYVQPAFAPEAVAYSDRMTELAQHDPAAMLNLTAAQADRQAREALGATFPALTAAPPQAANVAQGLIAGFESAAAQIPDMASALPQMTAWLEQHPEVEAQLGQSGDPASAAAAWANVYHAARADQMQASSARAMKLSAQTAIGAGGRPDPVSSDQQEWQKIMNTPATTQYWSR